MWWRMCVLLTVCELVIGQRVTWVWGDALHPPLFAGRTISERYPDSGRIRLRFEPPVLHIELVNRPPEQFWPRDVKFCSTMLPAAIESFMGFGGIVGLNQMVAHIHADPYVAACKCYLRVAISMNLTHVGFSDDEPLRMDQVEDFCAGDEVGILIASTEALDYPARLPPVMDAERTLLASANFVSVE